MLIYGAPLIRNITAHSEPLSLIYSADIPAELKLSAPSFVDFAILIGTDFSSRLKGLGPHRALKLLQTHETIERALEAAKPRYAPASQQTVEDYLQQVNIARRIFSSLPDLPPTEALQPKAEYDGRLVNEILIQFELTGFVARMSQGKSRSYTLEADYFATSRDELNLHTGTHSLGDDPRV